MSGLGFNSLDDVSINNNGQVVGGSYFWQNGVRLNLNDFLDASQGWSIATTADINDAGQVVGQGTHNGVNPSYFVLTIGPAQPPSLAIGNVSVTEGDSGSVTAVFTVTRAGPVDQTATVDFITADGTAMAGKDYVATAGTLTFIAGEASKTITVTVLGDRVDESDETFLVRLSNASNAVLANTQAVGTIVDNDPPPALTINDVTMKEGNSGTTYFVFTISLSAVSEKTVTVNFAVGDGTATGYGPNADYYAQTGILTFAPGETTKTISIAVFGDKRKEANETFFVNLSGAVNASILDGQGLGTILNDD
ncbi:MAG: hypothetical protein HYS12_20755 [Planctomycetes bacterium]|nr:hypothetical protein [Planctomycetota bacterium]